MEVFPPRATRPEDIETCLNIFRTVVRDHEAVYVSAPLTTGLRYAAWRVGHRLAVNDKDSQVTRDDFITKVVEPNRREIKRLVANLRQRHQVVIDPTELVDMWGWTQSDYRVLWGRVIERYVAEVVFSSGWQYSSGCAYEYLVSLQSRVRPVDTAGRVIEPRAAWQLIAHAVSELEGQGAPSEFLRDVLREVEARN